MAHFAELNNENKILRVVVACNQDIADNGGELSEQAATHFEKTCPFSEGGVKWVQTSYNNNFRKQFAFIGCYYDSVKDKFIKNKPYPSWVLNEDDDWVSPIGTPTIFTIADSEELILLPKKWDEENQRWLSDNNLHAWSPLDNSWDLI